MRAKKNTMSQQRWNFWFALQIFSLDHKRYNRFTLRSLPSLVTVAIPGRFFFLPPLFVSGRFAVFSFRLPGCRFGG